MTPTESLLAERQARLAAVPVGEPVIAIPCEEVLLDRERRIAYISLKALATALAYDECGSA